jgi:hypothetical protein
MMQDKHSADGLLDKDVARNTKNESMRISQ